MKSDTRDKLVAIFGYSIMFGLPVAFALWIAISQQIDIAQKDERQRSMDAMEENWKAIRQEAAKAPKPVAAPAPKPEPSPEPVTVVQPPPKPARPKSDVVLDAYSLLGESRAKVRRALRGYKQISRADVTFGIEGEEDMIGGEYVTYALSKGVEVTVKYSRKGVAKVIMVKNIHVYKHPLDEAEKALARFGVSGLTTQPEVFPAARIWTDFRDFKVRKVHADAQPLVADDGDHPYDNADGYVSDLKFELV